MKLNYTYIFFILLELIFLHTETFGQKGKALNFVNIDTVLIVLTNGSKIKGKIDSTDKKYIYVSTHYLGKIKIHKSGFSKIIELKDISPIKQTKNEKDTIQLPPGEFSPFQYAIVPSVFPVRKKKFYFENTMIAVNTLNYGFSDYFSLAGDYLLPAVFFINPRVNIPIRKDMFFGFGLLYPLLNFMAHWEGGLVSWYGAMGIGTESENFTLCYFKDKTGEYAGRMDGYAFALKLKRKNKESYCLEIIYEDFYEADFFDDLYILATVHKKFKIGNFRAGLFFERHTNLPMPYISYNKTF